MQWKLTPRVKIYEALSALADDRIEISGDFAKVLSSSRNKFYTVNYSPESKAIMVNDNASFYKGYLGYPAVAYLLKVGEITFDKQVLTHLRDIPWKDLNQKFKNNFEKAVEFALRDLPVDDRARLESEVDSIYEQLIAQRYDMLGQKTKPPTGY